MEKRAVFLGYFQDKKSDVRHYKSSFAERLASALNEQNIRLDLVDLTSVQNHAELLGPNQHISLESWLSKSSGSRKPLFSFLKYAACAYRVARYEQGLQQRYGGDLAFRTQFTKALSFTEKFATTAIRNKIDVVIGWNPFTHKNSLIEDICNQIGVKWLGAEGGIVPGTVEIDPSGDQWLRMPKKKRTVFDSLPISAERIISTRQYLEYVRNNRLVKKLQPASGAEWNILAKGNRKKVLLFAGMDERNLGIGIRNSPFSRGWSPVYQSGHACLEELSAIAKRNSWLVLYKPHPNMTDIESDIQLNNVEVVPKHADFFAVMGQCDALVTIGSTVAFHSILHKVPTVLVGCNGLSGHSICHEVKSKAEFESVLKAALSKPPESSTVERLTEFSARCNQYTAFSYGDEHRAHGGRDEKDIAREVRAYLDTGDWGIEAIERGSR